MSKLIYDNPWLVEQLLQAGLDSEKKLSKKGQAVPETPVAAALKSILGNLYSQINPQDASSGVSHETSGADVFSHNMDSMGDLVQWLLANGTKIGGKVIVYPNTVDQPSEEYGYFKIEPGTEIVLPIKRSDTSVVGYWINSAALKNYLVSLQADPKLKNNVMFQVQLLKLIQDANKQLDLDVSEQYKEPEKVLPDTTLVDKTRQMLDPTQWFNQGDIPLTIGDLKDSTTLNAWLSSKNIGLNIGGHTGGMGINHPEFDHCAVLKILNQRAGYNATRASTAEAKEVAAAYAQKVKAIAAEIKCDLSGQQQPGKDKPGAGGTGDGLSAATPEMLYKLSSLRPFNAQYISFPEIKNFVQTYASYANNADVTQMANTIVRYMETFKTYLGQAADTFQLNNLTGSRFKAMLVNANQGVMASDLLYNIITYAGQLYQRLVVSLQTIAQDQEKAKYIDYRAMQQQVTPGGPQQTNATSLDDLRQNIQREWNAGK